MRSHNNSDAGSSGSGKSGKKQAEKKKDSTNRPVPGKCLNCGKKVHWAKDWRRGHMAQTEEEEEPYLFLASVGDFFHNTSFLPQHLCTRTGQRWRKFKWRWHGSRQRPVAHGDQGVSRVGVEEAPDQKQVELSEEHILAQIGASNEHRDHQRWILDTGATNHMTGARKALSEVDSRIWRSVKFGDGSAIEIEGCGTIPFVSKGGEHQWLTGVYLIPPLKANIVSLGHLEEGGCHIYIEHRFLKIYDEHWRVLTRVSCIVNHLYILELTIDQPICLATRADESLWKWHARFEPLNFPALQKIFRGDMVRGLPAISEVNRLCNGCIISKQRRAPFPSKSSYRVDEALELVHGDLCGPIKLATSGGKTMFLLMVDDMSCYMWLILLSAKSDAARMIK
jgi:hypothetical protein